MCSKFNDGQGKRSWLDRKNHWCLLIQINKLTVSFANLFREYLLIFIHLTNSHTIFFRGITPTFVNKLKFNCCNLAKVVWRLTVGSNLVLLMGDTSLLQWCHDAIDKLGIIIPILCGLSGVRGFFFFLRLQHFSHWSFSQSSFSLYGCLLCLWFLYSVSFLKGAWRCCLVQKAYWVHRNECGWECLNKPRCNLIWRVNKGS